MKLLAAFLILAAASPVFAQDSDIDRLKREVDRLKADNEVLMRQLEVFAAQMKELTEKKANKAALVPFPPAPALKAVEQKEIEQERASQLADKEGAARSAVKAALGRLLGPDGRVIGAAPNEGKVTAVAKEIGLVVLSKGSDHGVKLGDEFTIHRGGDFVAKIAVDRVDLRWSAGKVVLKKSDPRVADDFSNLVFVSGPRAVPAVPEPVPAPAVTAPVPSSPNSFYLQAERFYKKSEFDKAVLECEKALKVDPSHLPSIVLLQELNLRAKPTLSRSSADEVQSLRKELDEVRNQVRQLSDRLVPSWQGAGVAVEESPEELRAHLGISRGLLVRRVREGSAAEKAGLKANDVIPELSEAQLLDSLEKRLPVALIRQGQRMNGSSPK